MAGVESLLDPSAAGFAVCLGKGGADFCLWKGLGEALRGVKGDCCLWGCFWVALGGTDWVFGSIFDLGIADLLPELIPWISLCAVGSVWQGFCALDSGMGALFGV